MEIFFNRKRTLYLKIFIWTCCTCSSFCAVSIEVISSPKELIPFVSSQIKEDCLLVLDIDDTILVSKEPILRAHLLDRLLNTLAHDFQIKIEEALSLVEAYFEKMPHQLGQGDLIFSEWNSLVQECARNSAKIIALTQAHSGQRLTWIPELNFTHVQKNPSEDRRYRDLAEAGVDLQSYFSDEFESDGFILEVDPSNFDRPSPVYKKGILLTNAHSKGPVLLAFLLKTRWKPSKVIFIDNLLKNVISVEESLQKLHIDFQGIHFTYITDHFCELDNQEFERQIELIRSQFIKKVCDKFSSN